MILKKHTVINDSLTVNGNILGKGYTLTVKGSIKARDIDVGNVNAESIDAWNVKAINIDAHNINVWNVNAESIDAQNIIYYAFCIAYNSIKCKSLKGIRENSFHKALDGKVIIKGK